MLEGTRLFSPSLPAAWPNVAIAAGATQLLVERGTVLDVAVGCAMKGAPWAKSEKVVAVNAASAYHAGGGFMTGGRHALEEAMCVQSSLYESLEKGMHLAEDAKLPGLQSFNRRFKWLQEAAHPEVARSAASCLFMSRSDDIGGVFYNRPEAVGASFGEALQQFRGRFQRVLISFPGGRSGEAFAAAAQAAFGGS
eukprot:Skav213699  [mRNA]  locus=scaffold491:715924:719131:- [translate_table: standard]